MSILQAFANATKMHLAFQGCEHINRALTMERAANKLPFRA